MKQILVCAVLFLLLLSSSSVKDLVQSYQFNHENVLGTSFELKVYAASEALADNAEVVALDEIDRLDNILSTYKPASEVNCWQKSYMTEVKVSEELLEVFAQFDLWRDKTAGALNPSVAVAINIWNAAAKAQQMPANEQLIDAVKRIQQPQWLLNEIAGTAVHLSRDPVVLSSFVKSYVLKKVAEKIMKTPGITGAVVNIGGDIIVTGDCNEVIRLSNPHSGSENDFAGAAILLREKSVATSGDYKRGFKIGSQVFSHILDARTALPVTTIASATVVAQNAVTAGALATAFNILTPEESTLLASRFPGIEFRIITKTGTSVESNGWESLITQSKSSAKNQSMVGRKNKIEATIELELAKFEGRFRRPFVAIWIENKKKDPVRTIAVWFNKPRWLPDLKKWFSKNQEFRQDQSTLSSVTSATRSPGKYTLTWDGTDQNGEVVPSGKYTIYIEAAREHGTYQLLKQEIDWNGKPGHFTLEAGTEITSASIDLHQVTAN
ncbi:hypothetical protein WSM22_20380 [Cytophagales bacterium WSM2-2]|nr:hypothetical protein WSM22_20380 [Cytophagales bacterium WSM2-2]